MTSVIAVTCLGDRAGLHEAFQFICAYMHSLPKVAFLINLGGRKTSSRR